MFRLIKSINIYQQKNQQKTPPNNAYLLQKQALVSFRSRGKDFLEKALRDVAREFRDLVIEHITNECAYCGAGVRSRKFTSSADRATIDHALRRCDAPEKRGELANLVVSCEECNGKLKGDIPLLDFLEGKTHKRSDIDPDATMLRASSFSRYLMKIIRYEEAVNKSDPERPFSWFEDAIHNFIVPTDNENTQKDNARRLIKILSSANPYWLDSTFTDYLKRINNPASKILSNVIKSLNRELHDEHRLSNRRDLRRADLYEALREKSEEHTDSPEGHIGPALKAPAVVEAMSKFMAIETPELRLAYVRENKFSEDISKEFKVALTENFHKLQPEEIEEYYKIFLFGTEQQQLPSLNNKLKCSLVEKIHLLKAENRHVYFKELLKQSDSEMLKALSLKLKFIPDNNRFECLDLLIKTAHMRYRSSLQIIDASQERKIKGNSSFLVALINHIDSLSSTDDKSQVFRLYSSFSAEYTQRARGPLKREIQDLESQIAPFKREIQDLTEKSKRLSEEKAALEQRKKDVKGIAGLRRVQSNIQDGLNRYQIALGKMRLTLTKNPNNVSPETLDECRRNRDMIEKQMRSAQERLPSLTARIANAEEEILTPSADKAIEGIERQIRDNRVRKQKIEPVLSCLENEKNSLRAEVKHLGDTSHAINTALIGKLTVLNEKDRAGQYAKLLKLAVNGINPNPGLQRLLISIDCFSIVPVNQRFTVFRQIAKVADEELKIDMIDIIPHLAEKDKMNGYKYLADGAGKKLKQALSSEFGKLLGSIIDENKRVKWYEKNGHEANKELRLVLIFNLQHLPKNKRVEWFEHFYKQGIDSLDIQKALIKNLRHLPENARIHWYVTFFKKACEKLKDADEQIALAKTLKKALEENIRLESSLRSEIQANISIAQEKLKRAKVLDQEVIQDQTDARAKSVQIGLEKSKKEDIDKIIADLETQNTTQNRLNVIERFKITSKHMKERITRLEQEAEQHSKQILETKARNERIAQRLREEAQELSSANKELENQVSQLTLAASESRTLITKFESSAAKSKADSSPDPPEGKAQKTRQPDGDLIAKITANLEHLSESETKEILVLYAAVMIKKLNRYYLTLCLIFQIRASMY